MHGLIGGRWGQPSTTSEIRRRTKVTTLRRATVSRRCGHRSTSGLPHTNAAGLRRRREDRVGVGSGGLGDPRRRHRSALSVIGGGAAVLFADRVRSSVGATPSPAVKGRCGIRLDPGGRRHAGAGVGLDDPRSASGRPLTAGSGMEWRLPALDGGPGGTKGAPPAIDQVIDNNDTAQHRVGVDEDAGEVVPARLVPMS